MFKWNEDLFLLSLYRLYFTFNFDILGNDMGIVPERYIDELRYVFIFNINLLKILYLELYFLNMIYA